MSDIRADAILSEDGRYRYLLTRDWGDGEGRLTFVMLNPSTADATQDDPTIRRCLGFARSAGFSGIAVLNLYAMRATDPRELRHAIDPVGPENDATLRSAFAWAAERKSPIVAAWGTHGDRERVRRVKELLGRNDVRHLGLTKDGAPRHPLYVPADQPLEPWAFATLAGASS